MLARWPMLAAAAVACCVEAKVGALCACRRAAVRQVSDGHRANALHRRHLRSRYRSWRASDPTSRCVALAAARAGNAATHLACCRRNARQQLATASITSLRYQARGGVSCACLHDCGGGYRACAIFCSILPADALRAGQATSLTLPHAFLLSGIARPAPENSNARGTVARSIAPWLHSSSSTSSTLAS